MEEHSEQLEAPGNGLPFLEWLVSRYWVFPRFVSGQTLESASAHFEKEGVRMLAAARALTVDQLLRPVLIKRIRGIEDSSRSWSVAMVLEHLVIVGEAIAQAIPRLIAGESLDYTVDIAAVKPTTSVDGGIIQTYEEFMHRYPAHIAAQSLPLTGGVPLKHPWFGDMDAFHWHCLAALHQSIHRRQIAAIVRDL